MELNTCICFLTISGTSVDLLRFDRMFEQNGIGYSLNNLYPTPADLDDNGAYSWRNSNWGTPWDINKCSVLKSDDCFEYVFKINWEAPMGAILEASRKYPGLRFSIQYGSYKEEGKTVVLGGETLLVE
jgi:hypothetical protein